MYGSSRLSSPSIFPSKPVGEEPHKNHNNLLVEMNDHYFKPRGLYAMIIRYKPNDLDELGCGIDVRSNITESVTKRDKPNRKGMDNILHGSADTVGGDVQIPEFAPLIFPLFNDKDEKQTQERLQAFPDFPLRVCRSCCFRAISGAGSGFKVSIQSVVF